MLVTDGVTGTIELETEMTDSVVLIEDVVLSVVVEFENEETAGEVVIELDVVVSGVLEVKVEGVDVEVIDEVVEAVVDVDEIVVLEVVVLVWVVVVAVVVEEDVLSVVETDEDAEVAVEAVVLEGLVVVLVLKGVDEVAEGEADVEVSDVRAVLLEEVVTGLDVAVVLDEVKESSREDNEELAVAEAPQSWSASDSASIELYAANQESNLEARLGDSSVVKGL